MLIGVDRRGRAYRETTLDVPPGATLVAYTDGLIERRGELLDSGMARLRDRAISQSTSLDDLVDALATEVAGAEHPDDTAILAVRWQS